MMQRFHKYGLAGVVLVVMMLSGCGKRCYQDIFNEQYSHCIQCNTEGLSLRISADKDTYYLGETIRITLTFTNSSDVSYEVWTGSYDRSGRIQDVNFFVDGPTDGFSDPLATYFALGYGMGGGLGGMKALGCYSQTFELNEWIRFDVPGDYRVYCTTSRAHVEGDWDKHVGLCSDVICLRIKPADKTVIAEALSNALSALKSKDDDTRRKAVRGIRFLGTTESVDALIPLLGEPNLGSDAFFGIVGARDWSHARKALHEGMTKPDMVVNSSYVQALARISIPAADHIVTIGSSDAEACRKRFQDYDARQKDAMKEVLEELAGTIDKKHGRALGVACLLLLEQEMGNDGLRQVLARSFQDLTPEEQANFLQYRWEQARCAEFEPILQKMLQPTSADEQRRLVGLTSFALLRYREYQPEKSRAMIIEDIKRSHPVLSEEVLLSLHDESLPEIDDVFASMLSMESDLFKIAPLIERYATAKILPQVIEFYERRKGSWACSIQESLLRYWLKHDRKAGLAATVEAVNLREQTRCYSSVLGNVLSLHYGPDAEKIAVSFLNDEEPDVVVDVVRLIAKKGSEDCIDALLARLLTLDLEKKEPPLKASFSEANAYNQIVRCIFDNDRWKLTDKQKRVLKDCLKENDLKAEYSRRFVKE